jgi:hypothetical protein
VPEPGGGFGRHQAEAGDAARFELAHFLGGFPVGEAGRFAAVERDDSPISGTQLVQFGPAGQVGLLGGFGHTNS